jgi:hypothetical protein
MASRHRAAMTGSGKGDGRLHKGIVSGENDGRVVTAQGKTLRIACPRAGRMKGQRFPAFESARLAKSTMRW